MSENMENKKNTNDKNSTDENKVSTLRDEALDDVSGGMKNIIQDLDYSVGTGPVSSGGGERRRYD